MKREEEYAGKRVFDMEEERRRKKRRAKKEVERDWKEKGINGEEYFDRPKIAPRVKKRLS